MEDKRLKELEEIDKGLYEEGSQETKTRATLDKEIEEERQKHDIEPKQPEFKLTKPETYLDMLEYAHNKITALETKILTFNQCIKDRIQKKKDIEWQIFIDVNNETYIDEKVIKGEIQKTEKQSYSNEKSREVEQKSRLLKHPEYSVLINEDEKALLKIKQKTIELEKLKREIKLVEISLKIYELRL